MGKGGFKKGKDWNGNQFGRPKGSQNRSTEMMKINIQRMINEGLDFMKEDYHTIREDDPAKALALLLKLMEYSLPKLKSVDVQLEADVKNTIEQIKVEIVTNKKVEDGTQSKD